MLTYRSDLKQKARPLRSHLTDSETVLWSRLRGKQILGVQFYRQKPIGDYIIDFFAPKVKLVVEVDGSQHHEQKGLDQDRLRDAYLAGLGLKVIRFNSNEVLSETDSIVEVIYKTIREVREVKIPPPPPFIKGGKSVRTFSGAIIRELEKDDLLKTGEREKALAKWRKK